MKCSACNTSNRPGATVCKQCETALPPNCNGCGERIPAGTGWCSSCRTERVPAALGAELALDDIMGSAAGSDQAKADGSRPEMGVASRFVGRQEILGQLVGLIDQAIQEHEPHFVAVVGAPGVGKTRLAQQLAVEAAARGVRVLSGAPGGPGSPPFTTFARMLLQRFAIADDDRTAVVRDKLRDGIQEVLPDSRVMEVAHLLAVLVGHPLPNSPTIEPLVENPLQLETRLFIGVRRFLAADAERQPLLLILDDVEHSSPEAINLTHYLAAGLTGQPVILLALARPKLFDQHPTYGEGDVSLERFDLGPLTGLETDALFADLTQAAGPPPVKLLKHARERIGGTPRALIELVRYLVESGLIKPSAPGGTAGESAAETWEFDEARIAAEELPPSFEGLLAARLRAMDPSERDLLKKAAVCGKTFWLDALVALVRSAAIDQGDPDGPSLGEIVTAGDRTRSELARTLKLIAGRGLLMPSPSAVFAGEHEYRFAYPPWWDVVYESIDARDRRRYHRLVAQWLELRPDPRGEDLQEAIARHLELAGDGVGAARHFRLAADRARDRYYNDRAIRLYSHALECVAQGDVAERIHLWLDLGTVYQGKGDAEHALAAFEHMLRLTWMIASRTKSAVAFNKMGRMYRQKGDLALAVEYLERGLNLFQQMGDERGVAGSLDDIGQVLWLLGRYGEALDRSAAALEKRRHLGDRRSIAVSLVNIGQIERHRGLFSAAESCYREALEIHRSLGNRGDIAKSLNGLGVLSYQRGDFAQARTHWEEALAVAEEIGALPVQALIEEGLGELARALGNQSEARTRFERSAQVASDLGDRRLLSEATRYLGQIELAQGNVTRALELSTHALEIAEAAGIPVVIGRALVTLGEVQAAPLFGDATGDFAEAEDCFQRGIDVFRNIGNEAELALALESFGRYRVEHGDVEAGKDLLGEAEEIFSRLGMKAGDTLRRMITELG